MNQGAYSLMCRINISFRSFQGDGRHRAMAPLIARMLSAGIRRWFQAQGSATDRDIEKIHLPMRTGGSLNIRSVIMIHGNGLLRACMSALGVRKENPDLRKAVF